MHIDEESTVSSIRILGIQQQQMADDIKEINAALKTVANALSTMAVLEQKHADSLDSIKRAHSRIDSLEKTTKDEIRGHEKRLQNIEVHNAKNIWIERLVMAVIIGVVSLWVKGGV